MLTISTLFESGVIFAGKKNIENRSNIPNWVLPTAIAGTAGLLGLGAYKYYQSGQMGKQESIDRLEKHSPSTPEKDLFPGNTLPEIKKDIFFKTSGYNIKDALSKMKPQITSEVNSNTSKNTDIDSSDREIEDLVSATQQI